MPPLPLSRSLDLLEAEAAALAETPFGLGHVAVLCALGQLDFRWPDCGWRARAPQLAAWEAAQATRPSVAATMVVDDEGGAGDVTAGQLSF